MATTYASRPINNGRPPLTIDVEAKARQDSRKQQIQMEYAETSDLEDEEEGSSGDEMGEGLRVVNGEEEDDNGSFSDSLSSSPSIPDEDIDFSLVYSLHTFLATVDGQASVVKGDKLYLLDDSNSYWWLVRVLKTQAVGYIPAENIETPYERLARLNKHRNVDLTSATQEDHVTGPNSAVAQTRFETRIPPSQQPHPHRSQHPSSKGVLADPTHKDHPRNISPVDDRPASRKGKTVIFTAPTYYEHSANGESDDYGDEEDEEYMMGDQNFEDEGDEESEFSDDNLTEDVDETSRGTQIRRRASLEEGGEGGDEEDDQVWEEERSRTLAREQAEAEWRAQQSQHRPLSPQQQQSLLEQQQLHRQQESIEQRTVSPQNQLQYQHQQQQIIQQQHEQRATLLQRRPSDTQSIETATASRELPELEEEFNPDLPTKKLSATPPIVRDLSFDINNPFADLPGGARSASPLRVRGVEVVDPRDPRYGKLISDRREGERRPSMEGESLNNSTTSVETNPTQEGSEDGKRVPSPNSNKLQKKASRESVDGSGEKKRKSGILSIFRKKDKDKKKKEKDENEVRSSEEGGRPPSSSFGQRVLNGDYNPDASNEVTSRASKRESQTAESMFSTESALRQQQVEAKQAMYHQYGVQRQPGDLSNTMTPRNNPSQTLAPIVAQATPARMRPGSLIGSPSIPGLDVPLLSVLRVFAGDNIESEATFKTVLLNRLTSSSELVKQSMQRFRLAGLEEQEEYYLAVRELGGEERQMEENEKPLVIFEELGDSQDGFAVPSVKRSSVGSVSSIRSNLSLNPAITRLGMNDFSDDSAVKFFLNRRSQVKAPSMEPTASILSDGSNNTSLRFAIRILIYPGDLPDNVVFDPSSQAIIPRSVLQEREKRQGFDISLSPEPRERIIFFPKNVNVSEVVEAGLDRFGIIDGVVGGGDEVEDRISRRRSVLRVKYGLAFVVDGREIPLNASTKILDSYSAPPVFKPYDRTTKEFKRRSVDATLILGSMDDVQYSDPIFIIRRSTTVPHSSSAAPGPIPRAVDELAAHQALQQSLRAESNMQPPFERSNTASSSVAPSVYATPAEELSAPFETSFASNPTTQTTPQTRQEIITAQRAASRASQNAILSAQKNLEQGVDINLPDRATVRSSRNFADDRVSYSYIDPEGDTTDISQHVESEWTPKEASRSMAPDFSSDSFLSALSSPLDEREQVKFTEDSSAGEDRDAVNSLRSTPVQMQNLSRSNSGPRGHSDVLSSALRSTSPVPHPTSPTESLQERLDRVLAKVKDEKARGLNGSKSPDLGRPSSRTRNISNGGTLNGRMSPLIEGNGTRNSNSSAQGRKSPYLDGRDSPSIDQIMNGTKSNPNPLIKSLQHSQQTSIGSLSSNATGTSSVEGFSTRNINTPNSSTARGESRNGKSIAYKEDFGLEIMINMIDGQAKKKVIKVKKDKTMEILFGRDLKQVDLHPEVRGLYAEHAKKYDDMDQRLDLLLQKLL